MADNVESYEFRIKNNQEKMEIRERQNKRAQAELESKITSINTNIHNLDTTTSFKLTLPDLSKFDKLKKDSQEICKQKKKSFKLVVQRETLDSHKIK